MCGFAGFTGYLADGDAVLERMMNKIIHRGPDSAGKYIDDKAYMGFRRLSFSLSQITNANIPRSLLSMSLPYSSYE